MRLILPFFCHGNGTFFPGGHAELSKYGPYAMYLFEFNQYLFKTEFGMVIAYIQGDPIPDPPKAEN